MHVGGKDVLPRPLATGRRLLARERCRQPYSAVAIREVRIMNLAGQRGLRAQPRRVRAGNIVIRSFIPLPSRTTIARWSKSTSFTRKRTPSMMRNPVPYNSSPTRR
jgi:hypothetical protein